MPRVTDVSESTKYEQKSVPAFVVKTNADTGQVEAIVSVFGVTDMMDDIIHSGSYVKTIVERSGQIRVLDNHRGDSTLAAIGYPIAMKEVGRDQLPEKLLEKYPDATGGLWTLSQFLLDTPEGKGVFQRLQAGALNEWSIGFDPLDADYSKIMLPDGKTKVVRNIRSIRLWEYSVVLWGANQATTTIEARNKPVSTNGGKGKIMPAKAKGDAPNYKQQVAGGHNRCNNCLFFQKMSGDKGTCQKYAFEADSDYVCDGYSPSNEKGNTPVDSKEYGAAGVERRLGDYIKSNTYDTFMIGINGLYREGYLSDTEHRALCETGLEILDTIGAGMSDDIALRPYDAYAWMNMMCWAAEGASHVKAIQAEAVKAGRVLSKRNSDRLMSVVGELQSVLKDAGLYEDESEADKQVDDKGADEPPVTEKSSDSPAQAGPDNPPTLNDLEMLKKSLAEIK